MGSEQVYRLATRFDALRSEAFKAPRGPGVLIGERMDLATVEAICALVQEEVARAVAEEREACAKIAEEYDYEDAYGRIRSRPAKEAL